MNAPFTKVVVLLFLIDRLGDLLMCSAPNHGDHRRSGGTFDASFDGKREHEVTDR